MRYVLFFLKLIRLPNLLIIAATQYVIRYNIFSPLLEINYSELKMSNLHFFLLSLSSVMIAASGYIINDYFDVKIDKINRPKTVIVGRIIKRRVAMVAHATIVLIAICIGAYLAYMAHKYELILFQLIPIILLWFYSTHFNRKALIGNVLIALLSALTPFIAGYYELIFQRTYFVDSVNSLIMILPPGTAYKDVETIFSMSLSVIMNWVWGISVFAFLISLIREMVKDIEDVKGDRIGGKRTLPIIFGVPNIILLIQSCILVTVLMLGYLQYRQILSNDLNSFLYFLFALDVPLLFLVYHLYLLRKEEVGFRFVSTSLKVIMVMGLLYTFLFSYGLLEV